MTHYVHPDAAAQLSAEVCGLALMAEFDFDNETTRVFSGSGGPLFWDGPEGRILYQAAGDFVSVSQTKADLQGRQVGHNFTIALPVLDQNGFSEDDQNQIVNSILEETWQGDAVRLLYGVFDETGKILGAPILIAADRLDSLTDEGDVSLEKLTVRSVPDGADRDIPVQRYYTPEDQRAEFPGDTGMDRQPQVGVQPIRIGAAPASGGGQSGSVSGEGITGALRGR